MAKSGLKHIDVGAELTKTEWESEDSHELLHGSSFPGTPVERQLFYRDDEHKWYIYNASSWVWLGGAGGGMADHGNEYHTPDFEQQGMAAALVESHRTTSTHTQDQPAAEHGNEKHNPDFANVSHTHSDLSPAHKDVATGVHGVGASTVESESGAQSKVDTHAGVTAAHSATSAATPSRIILRDASARAKVAAPSAADDIARKDTVDTHAGIDTGVHGVGGSTVESASGAQAKVDVHKAITTAVHGVGGSTVESASGAQAKVDAHKDITTGVHGAGASTLETIAGSQAKVDAHKDLATGAHGAGSNYLAQAPAASHLVRTFTKGWTSGKVLRGAGVAADPTELSSWTKIADITVTGSPVTYIDINSLDSDLDKFYVMFCNLKNHGAADRACVLSVNADYTESHYYCQVIDASGTVLTAARYNTSYLGGIPASGSLAVMAYLLKDVHGYFRYYTFTTRLLSTNVCIQNWAGVKSDATIAKITSLRIWMADANIAVGSNVILCKPLTD